MTLLMDTGCQPSLNEGVKWEKLKLLGSIQQIIRELLQFLLSKSFFSQLFENDFFTECYCSTQNLK